MAIKVTFNGAAIIKPGAYSKLIVQNLTGFPLSTTGVVGIVGEANGGEPRVLDILSREGIQDAKVRYKSGSIADALGLLAAPSNDPRIVNGASTVMVYKTNLSVQGSAIVQNAVPATVASLTSKNWGIDENNINFTVAAGTVTDIDATIEGTVAGPYDYASGSDTLILDIQGVTHTFTSILVGTAETVGDVIVELNDDTKWSPGNAPVTASLNTLGTGVKIVIDIVENAGAELDYGYISVDATSTLDTILGITGEDRGEKGSRIFTFIRGTLEEISSEIGGVNLMNVEYTSAGTACALSIQDTGGERKLTTTVTSGPGGEDLDILLQNVSGVNQLTIQELTDQINANDAYTATTTAPNPNRNADELDYYLNVEVLDVPLEFKADMEDAKSELDTFSTLVNMILTSNAIRALVVNASSVFLTGGATGTSSNTDFTNGFIAFQGERINTVIPLISQDVGSLTVDSINASAKAHVILMNNTTGKSERNAYCSKNSSKADLRTAAKTVGNQYVSFPGQQVKVLDASNSLTWLDPWAFCCIAAGMQAGSEVGEPITFKFMNINDLRVEDGSWDPKIDFSVMIEDGVLVAEPVDSGGFRFVVGNTSYTADASFVYNRISVVESAGFVAYDLRLNLEQAFTGTKAKTGTAGAIDSFIRGRMKTYLDADITVGDDLNDGLGFKNLSVTITGSTAAINMSVTPVQGIDFLLPTIYLADIQQTAA